MYGLREFLSKDVPFNINGQLVVHDNHYTPGYWTALVAHCRLKNIEYDGIHIVSEKNQGYASAIGIEKALNGLDSYCYERKNSGINYSELVHLNSADDTNKATSTINSCIRQLFDTPDLSSFSTDLCEVVGELHDNVWSHGMSTGFSTAQKWNPPTSSGYCFEFALADCGLGFLKELNRVGLNCLNDEDSIKWCIEKGNSSKTLKVADAWSQRLPPDIAGNPMPGIGKPVMSENNHMGLGLAKLVELVNNYKGQLWLSSGEKTLTIDTNGTQSFKNNKQKWQGVALACRFDTEKAKNYNKSNDDEAIDSLVELLISSGGVEL